MRNVKAYINSTTTDIYTRYGMILDSSTVTALMTPPPVKTMLEKNSRLEHGKTVITSNVRMDARDVQLTFGITAPTLAEFIRRYNAFCDELKKGEMTLTIKITEGSTYVTTTYNLVYVSCSQYSEYNGRLGKFVLKMQEPNPNNRTVEQSTDITQ